jgi:hypothetical protein
LEFLVVVEEVFLEDLGLEGRSLEEIILELLRLGATLFFLDDFSMDSREERWKELLNVRNYG